MVKWGVGCYPQVVGNQKVTRKVLEVLSCLVIEWGLSGFAFKGTKAVHSNKIRISK